MIDLLNSSWNHDVEYWHGCASSKDWRFRKVLAHDLRSSKVLKSTWYTPVWHNRLIFTISHAFWVLE
jgi:hypothetical protein